MMHSESPLRVPRSLGKLLWRKLLSKSKAPCPLLSSTLRKPATLVCGLSLSLELGSTSHPAALKGQAPLLTKPSELGEDVKIVATSARNSRSSSARSTSSARASPAALEAAEPRGMVGATEVALGATVAAAEEEEEESEEG